MGDLRSEFSEKEKIELEKRLELKNLFIDKVFLGLILTVLGGLGELYLERVREVEAATQKWLEYNYKPIETINRQYYILDSDLQEIFGLSRESKNSEINLKFSEYKKKIESFTFSINQNPLMEQEDEEIIQAILIFHRHYHSEFAMEYINFCQNQNADPDIQSRCTALRLFPGVLADNFKAALKNSVKIKENRNVASDFKIRGINYLAFADPEEIPRYVQTTISDFDNYLKQRKRL
ncbi:hypothetical protein CH379_009025 [Leptospira ellisii]|uniref:Uncharacterized protein n=1 Tax=Leptospira ellisii TaxID=2023197 RepID=A0A2N0BCA7_9LEPT|nr:hypothetical protein [Leptospira ellisii]MDV6235767.1 hypothetical protein [Leptospira ellisii]PJZ94180.1 hypothetical protein CH379_04065 [Leptospira ellisii]